MSKKLAIKGHSTRGKEVIELLEMLGGKNNCASTGYNLGLCYLIDDEFNICAHYFGYDDYEDGGLNIFTLEKFLAKYPFKVGDVVFDIVDGDPGIITAMKWDEDVSDMKYHIAFDNGDMGWYTNDTIGFLEENENLNEGKNMNKKLAIKGHPTRGNEVIEILGMLCGKHPYIKNIDTTKCNIKTNCYYMCDYGFISWSYIGPDEIDDFKIFTLEEFLEKYPFKVGDKVFLYDNITEGCVTGMKWDEDKGTVKYCVYTSAECWCDVKELLKWNNVDLVEKHYEDDIEEKDKAKAPYMKGEDYSGKRFGYKIPDGYEFDRVENGKIILKPIKPKYPKTYKECVRIAKNIHGYDIHIDVPAYGELMESFVKLLICRDAYWKIAGEQMGLGKPWESPLPSLFEIVYCIRRKNNEIIKGSYRGGKSEILEFPTEEMRDAFYENFKYLIEQCKELL